MRIAGLVQLGQSEGSSSVGRQVPQVTMKQRLMELIVRQICYLGLNQAELRVVGGLREAWFKSRWFWVAAGVVRGMRIFNPRGKRGVDWRSFDPKSLAYQIN